eukprot:scaffold38281_cov52-Attheya_sp.AAC.2
MRKGLILIKRNLFEASCLELLEGDILIKSWLSAIQQGFFLSESQGSGSYILAPSASSRSDGFIDSRW